MPKFLSELYRDNSGIIMYNHEEGAGNACFSASDEFPKHSEQKLSAVAIIFHVCGLRKGEYDGRNKAEY